MCIAKMLSAFWKSSCIFIILLLKCNLCTEIALIFATHFLYFSHHWFHWSLWYCIIAMLLLVEIIVKKRMHWLHFNCIFASSWMKTFKSTIFLMMNEWEMTWLTFVKWACISSFIKNMLYTLHATYIKHNFYTNFSLRLKKLLKKSFYNRFTV